MKRQRGIADWVVVGTLMVLGIATIVLVARTLHHRDQLKQDPFVYQCDAVGGVVVHITQPTARAACVQELFINGPK